MYFKSNVVAIPLEFYVQFFGRTTMEMNQFTTKKCSKRIMKSYNSLIHERALLYLSTYIHVHVTVHANTMAQPMALCLYNNVLIFQCTVPT